jgi:hypothetical protein
MKKRQLRMLTVDAGRAVLIARLNDLEIRRKIAALLGSLDDTLSEEQVFEELKALRAGHSAIFVDNATATTPGTRLRARVSRLWSQLCRKRG